ncbi:hypothetical protein JTB14_006477 [Gonioctena quinquepunctata]|nr:hypothetical protein JTB14_006477 [Gonioctena quinquepunctata]
MNEHDIKCGIITFRCCFCEKMIIYLCPTDKKYACSWEGQAEDILPHFEQEHDDLLHFNNFLSEPSENRLFLIDEEIYLVQIRISDKMLNIFLRYLGPARIATKSTYNIILKVNYEYCHPKYIAVMEQGFINVDLGKLEDDLEEIRYLQCSLNIIKETNGNQSDDDVFLEENSLDEETDEKLPHMPPPSKKKGKYEIK